MWFDTHCHLTGLSDDVDAALALAREQQVDQVVTVGCTVEDSAAGAELASTFDQVWATAGVHPHEAGSGTAGLEHLLDQRRVVAVGECGLDYHYNYAPAQAQKLAFSAQIELANRRNLALVIHCRDAWDDAFEILDREGMPSRTVFHCFTGGIAEASMVIERGGYVSFSGIVTFRSADSLREAAKTVPLNRVVIETDAPYLAPEPRRGKPNTPGNVAIVGEYLAELLAVDVDEFAAQTTSNALTLFGIGTDAD